ncbi:hypothetical protein AQI95_28945 [Streptomyces yokosukanensis]|uniref:DNA-binding phage zinc finger domain-containing protein n=1 Tax=Streptomyces yokosukanensis TaxID=67386 RepID=A0A101NZE4_9ACTN|nr:hypothetical protein [Streptomyces yokosukanensis]KUN02106.1 hypothetical protein AQI95_28945 [Streptomyces yokosukanensis]
MDRRETAALLAYIGRLDPRTIRTDQGEAGDQLAQWHELLGNVPMATPHGWDARIAARQHIRVSPYPIVPADIGRPWESYRRDRLHRHTDPTPSADPDDQAAWTAELVGNRHAVAAGTAQPGHYRQLEGRPVDPKLKARLRAIGSCIPQEARAALAPYRPARAAREAAVAQGAPDALSVPCQWCEARVGEPCRRRRIDLNGAARGNVPRVTPHPGRLDLAARQAQQVRPPAMV